MKNPYSKAAFALVLALAPQGLMLSSSVARAQERTELRGNRCDSAQNQGSAEDLLIALNCDLVAYGMFDEISRDEFLAIRDRFLSHLSGASIEIDTLLQPGKRQRALARERNLDIFRAALIEKGLIERSYEGQYGFGPNHQGHLNQVRKNLKSSGTKPYYGKLPLLDVRAAASELSQDKETSRIATAVHHLQALRHFVQENEDQNGNLPFYDKEQDAAEFFFKTHALMREAKASAEAVRGSYFFEELKLALNHTIDETAERKVAFTRETRTAAGGRGSIMEHKAVAKLGGQEYRVD